MAVSAGCGAWGHTARTKGISWSARGSHKGPCAWVVPVGAAGRNAGGRSPIDRETQLYDSTLELGLGCPVRFWLWSPFRARLDRRHRVQSALGPSHGLLKWLAETLVVRGRHCTHRYRSVKSSASTLSLTLYYNCAVKLSLKHPARCCCRCGTPTLEPVEVVG
jgi:hypothetical protein